MSTVADERKKYELMVIVDPDIGEKAVKDYLEKVRKHIISAKGEVLYEDQWGIRPLAYNIKKKNQGFYMILDFMLNSDLVKEFDRTLRLDAETLRHLLTVLPLFYESRSYAVQEEEKAEVTELDIHAGKKEKSLKTVLQPTVLKEKEEDKISGKAVESLTKAALSTKNEDKPVKSPEKQESSKDSLKKISAKLDAILENPDIDL